MRARLFNWSEVDWQQLTAYFNDRDEVLESKLAAVRDIYTWSDAQLRRFHIDPAVTDHYASANTLYEAMSSYMKDHFHPETKRGNKGSHDPSAHYSIHMRFPLDPDSDTDSLLRELEEQKQNILVDDPDPIRHMAVLIRRLLDRFSEKDQQRILQEDVLASLLTTS